MAAVRFTTLCRALGLHPNRVEQWISRDLFKPTQETTAGKAREWTHRDAVALLVFEALYSKDMPAVEATFHGYHLKSFRDDNALLVAWPDPRPGANGSWCAEIIRNGSFDAVKFMKSEKTASVAILSLDDIHERATAAIEKASE